MGPEHTGLRLVYVTDTMAGMQMLEGFAERFHLTLLVPAALGDRATNFWPPPAGVDIDRVALPGGRLQFVARAARWLARNRERHDVTVALDNLGAALGANLGRLLGGPPVVLQVGRPTLEYIRCQREERSAFRTWARYGVARLLIAPNERLADGIGAVSDYVAVQCARRNRNVRSIGWFGVDTTRFAPVCSKQEARRRLGLPANVPIVMWRSRLAAEKDPDTFLRAIARLRTEGREVCAVYMGGEIPEMEQRARRLGVGVITGKAKTGEEIPLWYIAADVNVQTSKSEGLGVSVLESLACETPVVVSDTGGLPETVDGGQRGALVPVSDDAATAAAIARFLDDPEAARAAGAAGRRFVRERYERAEVFASWTELVAGAARSRGPRRAGTRAA